MHFQLVRVYLRVKNVGLQCMGKSHHHKKRGTSTESMLNERDDERRNGAYRDPCIIQYVLYIKYCPL